MTGAAMLAIVAPTATKISAVRARIRMLKTFLLWSGTPVPLTGLHRDIAACRAIVGDVAESGLAAQGMVMATATSGFGVMRD